MKKYIYSLMFLLMAAVSVGLAACGDDDEPEGSDIVGTWSYVADLPGDFAILLQFTKDGKFHEVINSTLVSPSHGTYTVSGHKLYLTYILENDTATVEYNYDVEGDKLMLYVEGQGPTTFTRVSDSVIQPYL